MNCKHTILSIRHTYIDSIICSRHILLQAFIDIGLSTIWHRRGGGYLFLILEFLAVFQMLEIILIDLSHSLNTELYAIDVHLHISQGG